MKSGACKTGHGERKRRARELRHRKQGRGKGVDKEDMMGVDGIVGLLLGLQRSAVRGGFLM